MVNWQEITPRVAQMRERYRNTVTKAYFKNGGMEVQYNVVDRATLLDAQVHPERHRDLIVRVAGYSAFFNVLSRQTQDDIIARTEPTF